MGRESIELMLLKQAIDPRLAIPMLPVDDRDSTSLCLQKLLVTHTRLLQNTMHLCISGCSGVSATSHYGFAMIIILSASGDPLVLQIGRDTCLGPLQCVHHDLKDAVTNIDAPARAWMKSRQVARAWMSRHPFSDHARRFASVEGALQYYRAKNHGLPAEEAGQIVSQLMRLAE
jgi:hypothetical protein